MLVCEDWATWYNMHRELDDLLSQRHEVRKLLPKQAKRTYNPVRIHLHDVSEKEIVHFFSGPFDDESLGTLMRDLTLFRDRYIGSNSLCCGIRLVVVEDSSRGRVLPSWFVPMLHASMPEKTISWESIITVDVRPGTGLPTRIPLPSPRRDPSTLPGPDWNGIPGFLGGSCQQNLLVNLRQDPDFQNMDVALNDCIHHTALDAASKELAQQNPNWPRSQLGEPPEALVRRFSHMPWVFEKCAERFICPILAMAIEHHNRCKHNLIVIHLPSEFAAQIMELDCWKEFSKALDDTGVTWYPM